MERSSDTYCITMTGAELRRARKQLGLTQERMAALLGWQRNSIARCERNEAPILRTTELAVRYLLLTHGKEKPRRKRTYGKKVH